MQYTWIFRWINRLHFTNCFQMQIHRHMAAFAINRNYKLTQHTLLCVATKLGNVRTGWCVGGGGVASALVYCSRVCAILIIFQLSHRRKSRWLCCVVACVLVSPSYVAFLVVALTWMILLFASGLLSERANIQRIVNSPFRADCPRNNVNKNGNGVSL